MQSVRAAAVTAIVAAALIVAASAGSNQTDAPSSGHGGGDHDHSQGALNLWLISLGLTVVFVAVFAAHKAHSDYISESGVIIVTGAVLGGGVALVEYLSDDVDGYVAGVRFDQDLFINFILPIIIFEAGFSMKHGGVLRSLGSVLLLAIFGTLISSLIIGFVAYHASRTLAPRIYDLPGAVFVCLSFGALLSAVDPVAVIAVLGSKYDLTKEPPLLYNIVFGESVLNDAVAIVLFQVYYDYVSTDVTSATVGFAILKFLYMFFVSALLGYVYGLLCAIFMRFVDLRPHPHLEIIVAMLFSLGAYYLSEFVHLSGIMSLFVTARIVGHHASRNMSPEAQTAAPMVFKTLAGLCETAIFFLLGTALWAYPHAWNFGFSGVMIAACLFARAVVVFPLCALANLTRKHEKITLKMQCFIWYSGLRGAIAFGLAATLNNKLDGADSDDERSVLLSTTLMVVLFTVLVMGSGVSKLLKALGLDKAPPRDEVVRRDRAVDEGRRGPFKNLGRWLRHIERRFIHPFVRRPEEQSPLSPAFRDRVRFDDSMSTMAAEGRQSDAECRYLLEDGHGGNDPTEPLMLAGHSAGRRHAGSVVSAPPPPPPTTSSATEPSAVAQGTDNLHDDYYEPPDATATAAAAAAPLPMESDAHDAS